MPTADEVEALLVAGEDHLLIGVSESEQLDFKQQPHILNDDKGKWELAKDVAALANSGGGCLVAGVETTKPAEREDEVASEIKPFPAALADVQQVRAALDAASGVYPVLKGVTIRRFPRDDGKAMLLIRVPRQADSDLPFVVVRMVEGDEKRGVGVGVPFRSGSHTYWEPPGQLHRDLSDARRLRAAPVLALPVEPIRQELPGQSLSELTDVRVDEIEQFMGWSEAPTLLLAAVPSTRQRSPIDGFYDPAKIFRCIGSPPEIRYAGFSVAWPHTPENVRGSLVNADPGRGRVLWADPDGSVFAATAALPAFLTRSGGSGVAGEPAPRSINPTVVVEWTYLFFKLVTDCVAPSIAGSTRWAVRLRGAMSRPWELRLTGGIQPDPWGDGQPPGMDPFYSEDEMLGDPGRDAFNVLRQFYSVFGVPADEIPYSHDGAVDADLIRAISPA